ncbi:hypothetical protein COCNU_07G000180 [Cocos nucifera]|uniref:Uncharacterized protein n=1 Tax=Cocos nucifera TaxID=13894 RepID=A0A8K0IDK5_COCNU|nr:hypothetical protein COCNU_07G000180 [Cocos nucifera]
MHPDLAPNSKSATLRPRELAQSTHASTQNLIYFNPKATPLVFVSDSNLLLSESPEITTEERSRLLLRKSEWEGRDHRYVAQAALLAEREPPLPHQRPRRSSRSMAAETLAIAGDRIGTRIDKWDDKNIRV